MVQPVGLLRNGLSEAEPCGAIGASPTLSAYVMNPRDRKLGSRNWSSWHRSARRGGRHGFKLVQIGFHSALVTCGPAACLAERLVLSLAGGIHGSAVRQRKRKLRWHCGVPFAKGVLQR